jgi:hypothetical protein
MSPGAYRDPLESAVARAAQLEAEKAELLALTKGARQARFRTRAGVATAFAVMLVAGPTLAWLVRGKMPVAEETRTYEGKYTLHDWRSLTSATPDGPITLTVDPRTGKAHGWATGTIGSVRVAGQVRERDIDLLVYSADGDARGVGSGRVVGDAMAGSFGVPKMAASASFVVEATSTRYGP